MHRKSVVILFIMILTSAAVMGCSHTDGENNKHVMIETMSMTEKETPSETEQYIEITLPEVTVKDSHTGRNRRLFPIIGRGQRGAG